MSLPAADLEFMLFDWLDLERLTTREPYSHLDRATLEAVLAAAQQLADRHFAPHAARSDANEPHVVDGRVQLIPEIGMALAAARDAGFFALSAPVADGGMQVPCSITSSVGAILTAANPGTNGYLFLTQAAANLLREFASPALRSRLLPKLESGEWFGTMCLSEPHAGSSVGDIRTMATPLADGRYRLRGSKMWISGGEHELSGNIVHLVLARIAGAAPGTRGLSLFAVPRYRIGDDGSVGDRNGVTLAGINHKMGYRGTVNCLLDFGGDGECIGELVGEPHAGMRAMFHMMNEARIGVGIGASAIAYAGYLEARRYAMQRTQGRLPSQRDAAAPMQPLVAHADVRRMLLRCKCYAEGGLALCLYAAHLVEEIASADADAARDAQQLLDLLTPIVKSWPSEYGLEANSIAIQVLGGAGYTRDFPLERMYRDNRLNPIHEGTTGIQALDLLGRKVLGDGGAALGLLCSRIEASVHAARDDPALTDAAGQIGLLLPAVKTAIAAVMQRAANGDIDAALADASLFLDALGHVVVGWIWLQQAQAATRRLRQPDLPASTRELLAAKQLAARCFLLHDLPQKRHALALVARGDRLVLDAPVALL